MKENKVKLECIVRTNKNGGAEIPFEVGQEVVAEYTEHTGIEHYKSGAQGDNKIYSRVIVLKVTDKKINGIPNPNFIVDLQSKNLFCYKTNPA